jgi:rhodanese-related sulfurtransferase
VTALDPKELIMSRTVTELVASAREYIDNLDAAELARELADGALVVDIREADERAATGAIPGTIHVPRGLLEFKADPSHPLHLDVLDAARRTVLYCASGGRSALAARSLQELGYANVAHLAGGVQAWLGAGRTLTMD